MAEFKEVFDMVTKQTEPDKDSWKKQERRQRRTVRNRKVGAMALVAALVIGFVTVALLYRIDTRKAPAAGSPTTSPGLGTTRGLFIVDTDSGAKSAFPIPRPGASQFEYSPDGSQIAYSAPDEQGRLEVFVMGADGSNDHQLTRGTSLSTNPQWSPDGSMIAFMGVTRDSTSEIFLLNLSDGSTTRLTHEPRDAITDFHQAWAPDGSSFLFIEAEVGASGPGFFMAKTVDIATGETRTIAKDVSLPAQSPDGAQIVFDAWDSPPPRLSLMNSDGTGRHVIARLDGDGWAMWSPDGQQIAFVRNDPSGVLSTYLYDTTTGKIRFVVNGSIEAGGWVGAHSLLIQTG